MGARERHPPVVFDERVGDFGHRKHKVHRARHDRAARHAVIAGLVGILRDDEPAIFLHGLQPKAAVGPRSRKDHADGARTALLCQRVQQKVEGQARPMTRLGLRDVQSAVADGEIGSGRNDIEMLALDRHAIRCLPHRHRRVPGQQVHHHAFVGRIEMLDQDEGHAAIGRQRVHKLPASIKAARRGAYSDDREVRRAARRSARRHGAPARSRRGSTGLMSGRLSDIMDFLFEFPPRWETLNVITPRQRAVKM